jgi:hypothetical protein
MHIDAASEQHHSSISLNALLFVTLSGSRRAIRGFVVLMFMLTLSRANSHTFRRTAFSCSDIELGDFRDRHKRRKASRFEDSLPSRWHALGVGNQVYVTPAVGSVWESCDNGLT